MALEIGKATYSVDLDQSKLVDGLKKAESNVKKSSKKVQDGLNNVKKSSIGASEGIQVLQKGAAATGVGLLGTAAASAELAVALKGVTQAAWAAVAPFTPLIAVVGAVAAAVAAFAFKDELYEWATGVETVTTRLEKTRRKVQEINFETAKLLGLVEEGETFKPEKNSFLGIPLAPAETSLSRRPDFDPLDPNQFKNRQQTPREARNTQERIKANQARNKADEDRIIALNRQIQIAKGLAKEEDFIENVLIRQKTIELKQIEAEKERAKQAEAKRKAEEKAAEALKKQQAIQAEQREKEIQALVNRRKNLLGITKIEQAIADIQQRKQREALINRLPKRLQDAARGFFGLNDSEGFAPTSTIDAKSLVTTKGLVGGASPEKRPATEKTLQAILREFIKANRRNGKPSFAPSGMGANVI